MPSALSVSYQAARAGYHDNAGVGTLPCLLRTTDLWSVLLPNVDDTKFWVTQKVALHRTPCGPHCRSIVLLARPRAARAFNLDHVYHGSFLPTWRIARIASQEGGPSWACHFGGQRSRQGTVDRRSGAPV